MEDNNGTLQFTCLTQHIQQPPYLLIDQVDHSVICRLYDLVVVLAHFIKDDCRIVGVVIVVRLVVPLPVFGFHRRPVRGSGDVNDQTDGWHQGFQQGSSGAWGHSGQV